jgi:hypothetical protein
MYARPLWEQLTTNPTRRPIRPRCSRYRADNPPSSGGAFNGREQRPTVISGFDRANADLPDQVAAGQGGVVHRYDTEVVAQRRPTALNGVESQVNGTVAGDNIPRKLPDHFLSYRSPDDAA